MNFNRTRVLTMKLDYCVRYLSKKMKKIGTVYLDCPQKNILFEKLKISCVIPICMGAFHSPAWSKSQGLKDREVLVQEKYYYEYYIIIYIILQN